MTLIVQEVFQSQELDSTQLPPVPPVYPNLQLPGLVRGGEADKHANKQASKNKHRNSFAGLPVLVLKLYLATILKFE